MVSQEKMGIRVNLALREKKASRAAKDPWVHQDLLVQEDLQETKAPLVHLVIKV